MKRTLALWAGVSLWLVVTATSALAQTEPPPPARPVSAANDTLKTSGEEKPAATAAVAPDTVAAGARARRVHSTGDRMSTVFSLGLGSAINYNPDSFQNSYNPAFGILLSGGVRRWGVTVAASLDYNFFFANGTTPNDLNILMAFLDVKYTVLKSKARPYLLGCGGIYRTWIVNEHYTEVVLGYGAGAGFEVDLDRVRRLFFEGRYIQGQTRERTEEQANTEVIPFRLGLTWEIK